MEMPRTGAEQMENADIRAVSRFRRHADPAKDEVTGRSLDQLKDTGIEQAILIGCDSKDSGRAAKIKKIYHSPKERAWETLMYMMSGAGKEDLEGVRMLERSELDTMDIAPNVSAEMQWKDKEKEIKRNFDEMIDFILDHPEEQEEIERIAERMAHRVNIAGNMPKYLKAGDDVETESVTHGPIQEAFLKKVLVQKNEKRGFDSVSEIGGAFKPGEGFEIETIQKNDGTMEKKLIMYRLDEKGVKEISRTEHQIDWEEVKRLGELYRQKKVAEQKEKMKERKSTI